MVIALRKRLGPRSTTRVQLLSDGATSSEVTEWIPSGFPDLDRILGGGWAVGRCSEVFGDEASGKSALAHVAIRECQKAGGIALLLDFEQALDKTKIRNVGIDETKLLYSAPESLEEGWEIIWTFLASLKGRKFNGPVLIVWDSIAAALPKAEIEGKMEESAVGAHARGMSKGCRKAATRVAEARAHVMWVNQYRTKIGGGGWHSGPDKDTTGGRAPKFYASQRLECVRIKRIKPRQDPGTPPSGYLIASITAKCRLAPPHRKTEWVLDFKEGPSAPASTLHLLREAKMVRPRGSGKATAPWLPKGEVFRLRSWGDLWRSEPEFRRGARRALAELVAAGGVFEFLASRKGKDTEDEDESDG